ncbi:MAG: hypothetical protein PVF17_09760 [Ignavibacteria bacterium]|jgi:hypothetical protein
MELVKRIPYLLMLFALFTLSFKCSTSEESSKIKDSNDNRTENIETLDEYVNLAKEKFNDNYSIQMNSDKSCVLCFTKSLDGNELAPLKYFLYDLNNEKIIFEDAVGPGSVQWINDYQIQVSIIPGIVKGEENSEGNVPGYIYDIKKKKKIVNPIKELNK